MRILFITEWYPPYSFGGAGVYVSKLTEELAKLGLEIHIIAPGNETKSTKEKGIFVHRYKTIPIPFLSLPFFVYNYSRHLNKLMMRYKIDFIHSNDYVGFPVKSKMPMICTAHHLKATDQAIIRTFSGRVRFKIVRIFEESVLRKSQKIICVSKYTSDQLKKLYPEHASKSTIVSDGVDIKTFSRVDGVQKNKLMKRFGIKDCQKILFLPGGARGVRKGGDFLIKAAPLILAKHPEVKVIMSGSGWEDFLAKLAKKTNVDRHLIFTGELTEKELVCLYQHSDIICFPSLLEGFGLVVLEAMASKTPIIASNVGEIPNLIENNVDGLLVLPKNPKDIAKKINILLESESLRNKLVTNGWKKVQNYGWKISAKKTLEVYKYLLEQHEMCVYE